MNELESFSEIEQFTIEISKWLLDNDTADLPEAIQYSLKSFLPYIYAQRMTLLRINEHSRFEAAFSSVADGYPSVSIPEVGAASSYLNLIAKGEVVAVTHENLHSVMPDKDDHILNKSGIISHIAIPIKVRGGIWGSINASRYEGETDWDEATVQRMQSFGQILAATHERYSYWQTIQNKNIELEKLSRDLIRNQEVERNLLSRELHDNFSQKMALLTFEASNLVGQAENSQIETSLRELQHQIQLVATEMQALSRSLHPAILDDLGLTPAIIAECRRISELKDFEVQTLISPLQTLNKDLSLNLYRILQEALNNVAKHAKASAVFVILEIKDSVLHFQVIDDGVGCDLEGLQTKTNIGLRSITERTLQFNGEVSFNSPSDGGFSVDIKIPNIQGYYE
ncbi:GAF domain-containing sensor histidine kinase [Vibrio rotiferianus]|uniref:GAF domain-containing sensor histidine kinase n=1 Tax=Vibrio rotiferianus TaxID=190895 RepID=UPI000B59D472|nr:GAF domain-containing sensor histidine kinase [Vibrio rotiferianus]ASI94858.1 diguanylate cyclase [Vibrio rotiferianus]